MKLGVKIGLGFTALIIIAIVLGTLAIFNMSKVEERSIVLEQEYVPEVKVANDLRGAANRVMYEMRGYGFTQDEAFFEKAKKEIAAVERVIGECKELAKVSKNLKKLPGQIKVAEEAKNTYRGLMEQTVKTDAMMEQYRKLLDENAGKYMSNCADFLAGQDAALDREVDERLKKIFIVNEIVNIGTKTRVQNFKAQATNDNRLMKEAIENLDKVFVKTRELRPLCTAPDDIQRIEKTEEAAKTYKEELEEFVNETSKGAKADKNTIAEIRGHMDNAAGILVSTCAEFLNGQNQKMRTDVYERHKKITLVNDIIDIGNDTRIKAFKSQALRSPAIMNDAMRNFPKMDGKFEELKKITRMKKDLERIRLTKEAADGYKNAMVSFLANWETMQSLGTKRGEAGKKMINACKATAEAGMAGTEKIAEEAVSALDTASTVMIYGLVAAVIIGCVLAYLITVGITKPINVIIAGLTASSEQVTAASEQVSESGQSLAEGASEQASSLEEISSSLEEMSSMTKQNAENANQADGLAKEAQKGAEKGAEAMQRMGAAIDKIKESSDETAKIIKTIDEIAFQTNLLALNAAVEAARAGEAGKGFAVVAEEVRNLAQRSAEAAKDTSALIEGAQTNADNGVSVSKEVADILHQIVEGTSKVNGLVGEVTIASNEQAQGIEQVNTGVTQLDQVTQGNAANAEESASAGEELSAQAVELSTMVYNLVSLIEGSSSSNQVAVGSRVPASSRVSRQPEPKQSASVAQLSKAESIIPLDDADFADF